MIKIARIAVTLGLLSSLGAQAYAAGLVVNDNDLRNDLAWLLPIAGYPSEPVDLAAEPGRDHPGVKKLNRPILLSKWCWPVSISDCQR